MKQYYGKEEIEEVKQKTVAITVLITMFVVVFSFAFVGIINFLFNPNIHTDFVKIDGYEDIYYDDNDEWY